MNVTCTGCPAKYAVPDEKVRGKKVRITCKHCGTNIVVDGTVADVTGEGAQKPAAQVAAAPAAAATAAPVEAKAQPAAAKSPGVAPEVMYIVGFSDDRQHPHTVAQIVELYSTGKIDDEALVWKDGMPDWLSPFDVPELAAAFRAKNIAPRGPAPAFAPALEDEATLVVRSPLEDPEVAAAIAAAKAPAPAPAAALTGAAAAPAPAAAPTPAAAPAPAPLAAAPVPEKPAEEPMFGKPTAARRVEKRAGGIDLFGNVAEAGSEGDVSLDLGSSDDRAQKMTGARNESSVLFSLDALTKPDPKASKAKEKEKEREKEEASAVLFGESAPDSLMNLGGGGLGAMAAPDFTKPVSAVAAPLRSDSLEVPGTPANKGRGGTVLLVGFFGIAAAAAVAFVMMKKQSAAEIVPSAPSATTQAQASAVPSVEAPATNEAPATSAAAEASASVAPSASAAASANAAAPTTSGEPAPATPSTAGTKPATPASPATPAVAANKPAEPAAAKPQEAAPAVEGAAFDKNAAVAALGAAAANAGSCKQANGPTGSGKVSVTFAPSGRATATSVAGELAGTEVGGCVARLFRSAKVPPFTGDPVTVSKSFTVQ